MPKPDHMEELIGKKTGDQHWASHFRNFRGDKKEYEKYYENGKLKEGYSTSGDIGGSERVYKGKGTPDKYQRWGGGKDSYKMTGGSDPVHIYKLPEQKAAPASAPAPEPEAPAEPKKDKGPVKLSPEVAQAKERVNKWKGSIDGTAGSTFNTSAPATTPEPDAMPNSVSFAPAEINTPAYKPNDGNAEQAQSLADKYKLNLLNKGAGQSDFSGV